MHILLTRPIEDCYEMIEKFRLLGHRVSHLPLISIKALKYETINYSEYKAIIFTSSNAVKFLDIKNVDKKIICFCVGGATEKKARSVGFQNIMNRIRQYSLFLMIFNGFWYSLNILILVL